MKKLEFNDPETRTADIKAENLARLQELFPETFSEGHLDVKVLEQLLPGDVIDEREEKYGLNWHGKRQARQLALTPSTGTLRPCPEDSVDWDATRNLMIEGDNLEVLKLLQKSYAGKVKLIYIDPPYNTGKDFIYPDDFRDNIKNYLELTGQIEGGKKISSNTEASGRFHTDWLNMMYPRLKLARNLLQDDGGIFVSIDDHEVHNLRVLMSDVFGEENFVATVIWQKVFSPKNTARHFSEDHDYIVVYARNADIWIPQALPRTEEADARYSNPDNDPRGPWSSSDLTARNYYSEGKYEVVGPTGKHFRPTMGTYWRINYHRFQQFTAEGRIWWGADGGNMPRLKRFLSDVKQGIVPQTLWKHEDVGHTQEAKKELLEHVKFQDTDNVLDTVKPTRLLQRMLQIATTVDTEDIVVDFFSGSASTAHAVLKQNREDGGNRRFIAVQFPEPLPAPEPVLKAITDIGKERIRSVTKRMQAEDADKLTTGRETPEDLGFRVFKLDSSNIRAWEPERENLAQTLLDSADHLKTGRTEQDILYELLLKLGLDLCVPIEDKTIAGKAVHSIGAGVLLVCLAEEIARGDVEGLALGIVAWHRDLAPAGETTCVFRDSAFADDVAKTNLTAILQQHGLENVRSL